MRTWNNCVIPGTGQQLATPTAKNSKKGGTSTAEKDPRSARTPSIRDASKVQLDMTVIPEASAYNSYKDIPVARYISKHYNEICEIIEEAVHQKLKNDKMTDETYQVWKMTSSTIIRLGTLLYFFRKWGVNCPEMKSRNLAGIFVSEHFINFENFLNISIPYIRKKQQYSWQIMKNSKHFVLKFFPFIMTF